MVYQVRKIWRRRHQGSAALITTIAVSAILVVLFVGITAIVTREIRQSINADHSNRALYAAEAGVEDAVRILADDPSKREEKCNALSGNAEVVVQGGGDAAWTCRTITTTSDILTGRLEADESLNLNLALGRAGQEESSGYRQARYMKIEWNNSRDTGEASTPLMNRVSSWLPIYDPNNATQDWTGAAALEITASWFEANPSGVINSGSIDKPGLRGVMPVRTVMASSACQGVGCQYYDFSPWNSASYPNSTYVNNGAVGQGTLLSGVTARCHNDVTREYSCDMPATGGTYDLANLVKTEINNGTDNEIYNSSGGAYNNTTMLLRIRPRYKAASYRIQFFDSTGVPVWMPDGKATIDVTARSSNYFRRVRAKKQLSPAVYDGVFDNALFSGGDICKNMKIYRDYRGAPDYVWDSVTSTKSQNPNAGRNGCGNNTDV